MEIFKVVLSLLLLAVCLGAAAARQSARKSGLNLKIFLPGSKRGSGGFSNGQPQTCLYHAGVQVYFDKQFVLQTEANPRSDPAV